MTDFLHAIAEAWLLAFILSAGLTLGALLALSMGHLLREAWLAPLHAPLAAVARAAPVLIPLGLPLLLAAPLLYPWAATPASGWYDPDLVLARGLVWLLIWAGLGRLLARTHLQRHLAGAALLVLILTGALAMQDWALSRDESWNASLQGLALLVEQAGAALALATLLAWWQGATMGEPGEADRTGLERALLSLALATLWLGFVQYIVVYAADLPHEAAWYQRRSDAAWGWMRPGGVLPALLAAIALGLVPQWRNWRLVAVCALLPLQHLFHLIWIVRPDAAPTGGQPHGLADALVFILMTTGFVLARRRFTQTT